jgi:RNA polymerase sigma factor (sigma-70 family)
MTENGRRNPYLPKRDEPAPTRRVVEDTSPFAKDLREGGDRVWEQYYLSHKDRYTKIVHSIFGGWASSRREVVEDVVQNAFLKLFDSVHNKGGVQDDDRVQRYMYRTLINESLTYMRRNLKATEERAEEMRDPGKQFVSTHKHFVNVREVPQITTATGHDIVVGNEELQAVLSVVGHPDFQKVFLLHLEGKKLKEIAEELGIAEATARTRKLRATNAMKEIADRVFGERVVAEHVRSVHKGKAERKAKRVKDEPETVEMTEGVEVHIAPGEVDEYLDLFEQLETEPDIRVPRKEISARESGVGPQQHHGKPRRHRTK